VIFNREGYIPALFRSLQQQQLIAALTYHRYRDGDWLAEEFREQEVKLASGEKVLMKLAERRIQIGKARQRHQGQQQKHAVHSVEADWQRVQDVRAVTQPERTASSAGKCVRSTLQPADWEPRQQHTALRDILCRAEKNGRCLQLTRPEHKGDRFLGRGTESYAGCRHTRRTFCSR